MQSHYLKTAICSLVVILFVSCKKETVPPVNPALNYFPLQTGKWAEYVVDSIVHADNDNNNDDSVYSYRYYIREVIDHTITDGVGDVSQVIYRYKRNMPNEDWSIIAAWTQKLNSIGAYRTEENVRYQKLAFPISRNTEWNGNNMNTLEEQLYSYTDLHQQYSVSNLVFDSTITVVQLDENNFIERNFAIEVYATDVGVVFKQNDRLEKRLGVVVEGLEYKMELIAYGE